MDASTVIRIVSGILAVIVLGIIIMRRKRQAMR
jgi:NhaP-type Na+/H+ or K+/H+ antiporter